MMSRNGERGNIWKSKRWLAGFACALLLVVLAVGIFLWAPWEAGQDGSDATQDLANEIQDVTDEQEQSETGDEGDQSEGSDSDTQAEDEEWPGQSLGYVGPNGEGALNSSDYESDEDYLEALAKLGGGIENDVDTKSVVDPDGQSYEQGVLLIYFYRTCSEYDAHQLIEERGGVWQRDSYIYGTGRDTVFVSVYFPDCLDYESLIAKKEEITSLSEVSSASLNYAQTLD